MFIVSRWWLIDLPLVYALYECNVKVGIFVLALLVLDGGTTLLVGIFLFLTAKFDATCSTSHNKFGLAAP